MYGVNATTLCDTSKQNRQEWLKARMHGPKGDIPYTLGGSDIPVIYGVDPWTTPLELWHEKRIGIVPPDNGKNTEQKRMGHLFEPVIARLFAEETGFEIINDQTLYQHRQYEWALADIDRLYVDKQGCLGILEIKLTHFRNANLWRYGLPYRVELQVRHYMFVLDIDCVYVKCVWGMTTPSVDSVTYMVVRDRDKEESIITREEEFIFSLENGIEPKLTDYPVNPKKAIDAINRIYGCNVNDHALQFDATFSPYFLKILELNQIRLEKKQELKQVESNLDRLSIPIIQKLKDHDKAICKLSDGAKIDFTYKREVRKSLDIEKLKSRYPKIYKECLDEKPKISRGIKRIS